MEIINSNEFKQPINYKIEFNKILQAMEKEIVRLRQKIKEYNKIFFLLFAIFIIALFIQNFYLEFIHRGEILKTVNKYTDIYNKNLDSVKEHLVTLQKLLNILKTAVMFLQL